MQFIETSIFTKQITQAICDDDYKLLQQFIITNPEVGKIITGSSGLRKMRWSSNSKGKRGGIRVIYYWYKADEQFFMLLAYQKNEKDNLSKKELTILSNIVKEYLL